MNGAGMSGQMNGAVKDSRSATSLPEAVDILEGVVGKLPQAPCASQAVGNCLRAPAPLLPRLLWLLSLS